MTKIFITLFLCASTLFAQQKQWVYFSPSTPLTKGIELIKKQPIRKSNWLNAATFDLTSDEKKELLGLPYISKITTVKKLEPLKTNSQNTSYSKQLEQLNTSILAKKGYTGKGISIGIIDAGFKEADSSPYFKNIFSANHIKATKDFVNPESINFYEEKTDADDHGTKVWKRIAGTENDSMFYGLAKDASFYLARTEIGDKEIRLEEDYWIEALEWMESKGVKLINSSLGYANKFDSTADNHLRTEMDGETTAISKAAQYAAEEKGMLIIVSAGNLGSKKWGIISAPADAPDVLTVGATSLAPWTKMGYSSTGPSYNKFLKPDVASYSTSGTSFSAPIITGLAACLWQANPKLSNKQLKKIIEQSSHLYPYGNNYIGYGVPNANRAIEIINKQIPNLSNRPKLMAKDRGKVKFFIKPTEEVSVALFQKSDKYMVIKQSSILLEKKQKSGSDLKNHIKVKRGKDKVTIRLSNKSPYVQFSSLVVNNRLFEIEWRN
ncbi:MAG: S8 family serine peptidase [Cyclobacteriaceae bacterium]